MPGPACPPARRSASIRPRTRPGRGRWWWACAAAWALVPTAASGQSPDWSATLLSAPFPSPFVSEWERNPQTLTLSLNYLGSSFQEFTIEGEVRGESLGLLALGESPPLELGPGPVSRVLNVNDIFDWRLTTSREVASTIVRSGVIPEGEYEACARVLSPARIEVAEACTFFSIALPDTPELLFPTDGDPVQALQPTFQWTPVSLPPLLGVRYRIRMAELQPRQTPEVALEANVPHLDQEVATPLLVYPLDALDLIPGTDYVWQVEALDGAGEPVLPGGLRSEIHTFRAENTVAGLPEDEEAPFPDAITLVPGLARVTGLSAIEMERDPFGVLLNGPAWLELADPYQTRVRVRLEDLTLSSPGWAPTSGRVVGAVDAGVLRPAGDDDPLLSRLSLTGIEYRAGEGLRATGSLDLAAGSPAALEGEVQVTSAGLFGTLRSTGGQEVLSAGGDPVRLVVRDVTLELPAGPSSMTAEVEGFGGAFVCRDVTGSVAAGGLWEASLGCVADADLPLTSSESPVGVHLSFLNGSLGLGLDDSSLSYDLDGQARFSLDASATLGCRADLRFVLTSEEGLSLSEASPRCQPDEDGLALDWLTLAASSLRVPSLGYTPGAGVEVEVLLDLQPELPALSALPLPPLAEVRLDGSGLTLPGVSGTVDRTIDLLGYGLRVDEVATDPVTISWADWTAGSGRGIGFRVRGELFLPGLPVTAPTCLAGGSVELEVGSVADGLLRLPVAGSAGFGAGGCAITLGPGLELALDAPGGALEIDLTPPGGLTTPLQVTADLVLPDTFQCTDPTDRAGALSGSVGLLPGGGIEGSVTGFDTDCAFPVAGLLLEPGTGTLDFAVDGGTQEATLRAGGGVRFAADSSEVSGTGEVVLDLVAGRLVDGSLSFVGPFDWNVPAETPLFTFSLDAATLDPSGLSVDGRHRLVLGSSSMNVTFDQVTVGWEEGVITAGRVLFDSDFALEAGIDGQGALSWTAREAESASGLASAFRVELPATTALGAGGLSVDGDAGAALSWEGRALAELDASFTDGFLLGLGPVDVDAGRLGLASRGAEIAYVDELGFHPNLGILGTLIPDRLPLPSEAIAFLELRDDQGALRVQSEETPQGLRVFTGVGETVPLVLPAFRFGRGQDPRLDVAFDLTLSTGATTLEVVAGSLDVALDPVAQAAIGLDAGGIPFVPERVSWSDPGGGYRLALSGRPVLLGDTLGTGTVELEANRAGRLAGAFSLPVTGAEDLVAEPGRLRFDYSDLQGSFDVDLLGGGGSWSLGLDGALAVDLSGGGSPLTLAASLEASPAGIAFSDIAVGAPEDFHWFGAGPLELGMADLSVPTLSWDSGTGWDFEIDFDLAFRFPELDDLVTPTVPDLTLDPTGFTVPELTLTSLPAVGLAGTGFQVTPLALRLPSLRVEPFQLGLDAVAWDLSFDLGLSLGADAPSALAGLELTVLDASLADGIFAGQVEPRLLQNPLSVPVGGAGMALELDSLAGSLFDDAGVQGVTVEAAGSWRLPDFMSCSAQAGGSVDLGSATLALGSDGTFTGTVQDLAPACPLDLGPLALEVTTADLVFAAGTAGQEASLDLDGAVRLPGLTASDTVTASGALVVDLLVPEIESGSIQVTQPFRWDLPRDDPFLTFTVNEAVLDTRGLVLGGSGDLLLDGATGGLGVTFSDLTLGLPELDVSAGSASFASGFALDAVLNGNAIEWTARASSAPAPSGDAAFRMSLPASVSLDGQGIGVSGTGSASLTYADSTFASLDLAFSGGFGVGWDPAAVVSGRADFLLGQTEVAYLTSQGFFPGDLFGLLPVPARLPLPSEDVAYLQLRDPATDQVLVQSEQTAQGVRIFTGQGSPVSLVIPGLAGTGGAPSVDVAVDVEVDGQSYGFLSGAVVVEAGPQDPSLVSLAGVDLPLDVRRLAYESGTGGYGFTLDARVDLPASMSALELELEELELTSSGLTGEALLGSMRQGWQGASLATADLGAVSVRIDGARATFGQNPEISLEGGVDAAFFSDASGTRSGLDLSGTVTSAGATFDLDPSGVPTEGLPIGLARFAPSSVGSASPLTVTATDAEFALGFSGVLSVPSLAPAFAVSLAGVSLGTGGVELPTISLTTQSEFQLFELFGASFTLMDTQDGPAIGLDWDSSLLTLTMNGELDFLDQINEFRGLQLSTDGSLGLSGTSLVDGPVTLVTDVLDLTALGIEQNRLEADLALDLPAPFDGDGTQTVSFSIGADGSVEGSGQLVLLDETTGLGGDRTQFGGVLATAHLKYLGLEIDPSQGSPGSLQMVGDLYLADDRNNRIALGDNANNAVLPGLEIGLDGQVQWGNFSVPSFFSFDFEVLRLDLDNVSGGGSGSDFEVEFGGELALDFPVISGSLGFSGFRVGTELGLNASGASVQSGNLTIADVVAVSLSAFDFSGSPSTLDDIQTGLVPTSAEEPGASASSTSVAVQSYVRFGGGLSVGPSCGGDTPNCLFSGGVQEFLFYRTADEGLTNLVIRQASLSVPSFSFDADFMYSQKGTDGSFEVVLGGSGSFSGTDVSMVGALERGSSASDLRAGLFLIASQEIQIVPAVLVLSEIGGGFFYRPKPEYCELVRQVSGVPDLSSSGSSCENVGKFTGFLYAGARVVTESLGKAQILLTASETGIQIDGVMAVLSPNLDPDDFTSAAIHGTMNLTVGFQEAYAEGNFTMTADYRPLVYSRSEFGFYVYGSDAWGIYGSAEVDYLGIIRGDADFFVGADGFFVKGGIYAGFDFWIVAVSAQAEVAAWYLRGQSPGEAAIWGAYLEVEVKAEILGGAVSARAGLTGALDSSSSGILVYAEAMAEGCVIGMCKSVWVYAKFRGGTPSGGFGRDESMRGILANARRAQNTLMAARDRVQDRVAESRPGVSELVLSDDELQQTYAEMITWSRGQITGRLGNAIGAERGYRNYYSEAPSDTVYFNWYRQLLARTGFPVISGNRTLNVLRDTVDDRLQRINGLQAPLAQRLGEIQLDIGDLQEITEAGWPAPPLSSASIQAPQAQPQGDGTMAVQSQPGVTFDRQGAADASRIAGERNAQTEQVRQQVVDQLQALEDGLAQTKAALAATGDSSVMAFARLHGDALQAAEEMYARHGDLILRQQDWYRDHIDSLQARQSQVRQLLVDKHQALRTQQSEIPTPVANLAGIRAYHLSELSGNPQLHQTWLNVRESLSQTQVDSAALNLGMQLWYELGVVGMQGVAQAGDVQFAGVQSTSQQRLNALWGLHWDLTQDVDDLFGRQAELTGSLYDMYDRFAVWLEADAEGATAGSTTLQTATGPDFSLAGVRARMQALEDELQVPTVDRVNVVSQNEGYMAREVMTWAGSHPTGTYEYLYNSLEGGGVNFFFTTLGMQSNGARAGRWRYALTPGRGTTSQDRTLRVGVRGGAGYLGFGRSSYETRFEAGSGGQSVGNWNTWNRTPDTSPPSEPRVRVSGVDADESPFWTSATTVLDGLSWLARDYDSGIQEYEYALGWQTDTTAVLGWTSAGGRTEATLRGFTLQEGGPDDTSVQSLSLSTATGGALAFDPDAVQAALTGEIVPPGYRLFVRATNGEGREGPVGRSAAIRVDRNPPEWADGARLLPPIDPQAFATFFGGSDGGSTFPQQATSEFDRLNQEALAACGGFFVLSPTSSAPRIPPSITLTVPDAQDARSGVAGYAWRVGQDSVATYGTGAGWSTLSASASELTIQGPSLDYRSRFWVHMVALDRAGHTTEPLVYGPFTPHDPTPPEAPTFCLNRGLNPSSLRFRVDRVGGDPEVGGVTWSYRVRTPGGTVVRDWPQSPDYQTLGRGEVKILSQLALTAGQDYYLDLRATNRNGESTVVSSGPIRPAAPPAPPVIHEVQVLQGSNTVILLPEILTPASSTSYLTPPPATHHWRVVGSSGSIVAQGSFVGDVGTAFTTNLGIPLSSVTSGAEYLFRVSVETASGLRSSWATWPWTMP